MAEADDAPVTKRGSTDAIGGLWRFQPVTVQNGLTEYEIVNINNVNRCLSVYYNSTTAGGKIVIYKCNGWADQLWTLGARTAPWSPFNPCPVVCTWMSRNSGAWDTQLIQGNGVSGSSLPEQYLGLVKYSAVQTSPWSYRITTTWSLALDVASNDNDAGVIESAVAIGSSSQKWSFDRQSDGFYELPILPAASA